MKYRVMTEIANWIEFNKASTNKRTARKMLKEQKAVLDSQEFPGRVSWYEGSEENDAPCDHFEHYVKEVAA